MLTCTHNQLGAWEWLQHTHDIDPTTPGQLGARGPKLSGGPFYVIVDENKVSTPFSIPPNRETPTVVSVTYDQMEMKAGQAGTSYGSLLSPDAMDAPPIVPSVYSVYGEYALKAFSQGKHIMLKTMFNASKYYKDILKPGTKIVNRFVVPKDQMWLYKMVFSANQECPIPIAKFTHPNFGNKWGIYVHCYDWGMRFSIRKIDMAICPSGAWYKTAWNWVKDVFAELVSYVAEAINWFKEFWWCPVAKFDLDLLSSVIEGKTALTSDKASQLQKAGVTAAQLASLKVQITAAAASAIGGAIVDKVCGAPAPTSYPAGTICTHRTPTVWRVATPVQALSGKGDYTITETESDPTVRGAKEVPAWLFEYRVGERAWYETPYAWGGFAAAALGLAGGAYLLKRRHRKAKA